MLLPVGAHAVLFSPSAGASIGARRARTSAPATARQWRHLVPCRRSRGGMGLGLAHRPIRALLAAIFAVS